MVLLAAPLNTPPQKLTTSLNSALTEIISGYDHNRYKNTAHFNFEGGLRDFHVTSSTASFTRLMAGSKKKRDNYLLVPTTDMKNVYSSLDHNS